MDSEDSYIGKQIGNYRVVDELGGGGFGNVYRAQHIFLAKRIVAIKLLNASRLSSRKEVEALNTLERAIVLAPNDMTLFYGKGLVSAQLEHDQDALLAYEQAIRLDPRYALAWRKKGDVLRRLNRHDEALAAYEHATQLEAGGM